MVPVLLGVGALAGTGGMSLALALGAALAASLPPDLVWYELGRRRGGRILGLLCRVSLEPDSCVRRAENLGWVAIDDRRQGPCGWYPDARGGRTGAYPGRTRADRVARQR